MTYNDKNIVMSYEGIGKLRRPIWQRVVLLCVLGYEAIGCLLGGSMLVAAPDGSMMSMPVHIMHGVFANFLIPGIILFSLGILNTLAFFAVLRRRPIGGIMAGLALGGLAIWFWIEIAILQELHWLHAMWGLPVVAGIAVTFPLITSQEVIRKGLLVCGIAASMLYVVINIVVAMQWKEYSIVTQTISELSAIGAPTRIFWIVLSTPYTVLMIAFGWGVWVSGKRNKPLRIAGILLIIYAALGILWPFAPMHLREALALGQKSLSDTLHLTLGIATELIYLAALSFVATALGRSFRNYSIATVLGILAFGILTFMEAPGVARNELTPTIGIWERINIGIFLLWVTVLATTLINKDVRNI